jgi:ParB/RepB/Spo0J family partition protein
MATIAVSPFRCRVWGLHARLDESLTEESCRTEIESFAKHGQLIPALGRRLRGHADFDVELIYGARRLFVARHLNLPLLVELRDICDRDGIIAMDLENRLRQDVSPYERATSYDKWLRNGHFSSQDELASALQVSAAQVSRLLSLARLPTFVTTAFGRATDMCEAWGAELAIVLKDRQAQHRVMQAALSIAATTPRPPANEIYQQLCIAGKGRRASRGPQRIVTDKQGAELFRVKQQRGWIVFSLSMNILSQRSIEEIECELARLVDAEELPEEDAEPAVSVDVIEELPAGKCHILRSEFHGSAGGV